MKFEGVTGKSTIYVYQDFWSRILVYNMIQDIRKNADEEAAITGKKGKKYPIHTNENLAIGLFKESMIKIVLENSPQKRVKMLEELQKEMDNHVLPVRELLNKERKKNLSNKYKNNQKNSF